MDRNCWCENNLFTDAPNQNYRICTYCGTASLKKLNEIDEREIVDEEKQLYGSEYWKSHMIQQGYPDIYQRSRLDLTERNIYWLKALLKYCLPPAKTLEIGCAHGSFVKLLKLAGFESTGIEMSPNIISFAKKTFDINVLQGPINLINAELGKFDVILAFDVIEHFQNPFLTISELSEKLNDNGMFVIQTPNMNLCSGKLWPQFRESEHTFLFTQQSLCSFFKKLGFSHFEVEPACFEDDQFVFVSKKEIGKNKGKTIEDVLLTTPNGRIVLALKELYDKYEHEKLRCFHAHGGGWKLLKELSKSISQRLINITSPFFRRKS